MSEIFTAGNTKTVNRQNHFLLPSHTLTRRDTLIGNDFGTDTLYLLYVIDKCTRRADWDEIVIFFKNNFISFTLHYANTAARVVTMQVVRVYSFRVRILYSYIVCKVCQLLS